MSFKRIILHRLSVLVLIYALAAFFALPECQAVIRSVTGTVTKVSDGDTLHVTTPEQTRLKVRLYGIDAPETPKVNQRTGRVHKPGQPFGEESWRALQVKTLGKQVRVDVIEFDKYRRAVCMVWLDSRNINLEMIREGYAEAFAEYLKPPYRQLFLEMEQKARADQRGIWFLPDYERPRAFRKRIKIRGGQ